MNIIKLGLSHSSWLRFGAIGLTLGLVSACGGTAKPTPSSTTSVSSSSIPKSSSLSSSSTSSRSSASGNSLGSTLEAENLIANLSSQYELESLLSDPDQKAVSYFDTASVICYSVNLTNVKSIDFLLAKGSGSAGRFAILVGGNNTANGGTNVGEKIIQSTGDWNTYKTVNVGLSKTFTGTQTLCLLGISGSGIFNLDKFTLSDVVGQNDGVTSNPGTNPEPSQDLPSITTQGNKVLFGGQAKSIAGMSMFWSNTGWGGEKFYNADMVRWLKQDWNAKLIRAAMGVMGGTDSLGASTGDYIGNPDVNKTRVKAIVNAAIDNDMYVIIDWHTHDGPKFKSQAIAFFDEMSKQYGKYNNVIYEVFNEPLQVSWTGVIKPYAEEVIAAIRKNDPDNLIIVGTPAWSQDVDVAAQSPITSSKNIAYTLHFYAGTHKQLLRDKAQQALQRGIPLFVTEWGTVEADGDGAVNQSETQAWMQFLKTNNISHANWSLNDKKEGASALNTGASANGNWNSGNLSASGQYVKNLIKTW